MGRSLGDGLRGFKEAVSGGSPTELESAPVAQSVTEPTTAPDHVPAA
jgi:hypothetical protein